jgi:hypothetical protein
MTLFNKVTNAVKGIAPIYTGHEPIMLLLHQTALFFNKTNE